MSDERAEFEAWLDYWWDISEWSGEDKEEGFLAFKAARRTQDAKVRELVEAVDRMIGHPDTKTFDTSLRVEMDTNLLVDVGNARNALAQLKEQPND